MTALSIIQDHCRKYALSIPTSVINSTDTGVQQLYGLLKELIDEMITESKFNVVTLEATFVTTAAEDQGAMTTLAPYGYQSAIFETFYDRTLRRPLYGPVGESDWQALKAIPNPGPFYKFRIRNDHLLLNPIPVAPLSTIAFEYMSSWAVKSVDGVLQSTILADNDVFVFPDYIIRKGLAFYWKALKGLPYQADETQYYNLLNNYIAKDKVKSRINVSAPDQTLRPGIFVPAGSWPTT